MKYPTLLIALCLTACGTLPEPFYGNPGPTGARLSTPPPPVLIIPTPNNALLGDSAAPYAADLATTLSNNDLPSITGTPTKSSWTLTTTATLATNTITPTYTLTGPNNTNYGATTGTPTNAATWANPTPQSLTTQATADAPAIIKLLQTANAKIQGSDPNSLENRPPRLFFTAVTGAPTDGNQALTLNITRDLPPTGIQLTKTPATADFTATATVTSQPDTKNQIIVTLNWTVYDSYHRKIGQVTQLHELNLADITPYWGDIAAAAAAEAASGIHTVINNATLHKNGGLE